MTFEDLYKRVKDYPSKKIAAIMAQDIELLKALKSAKDKNIAEALLIGNKNEILEKGKDLGITESDFEIIEVDDGPSAVAMGINLIYEGKADLLIKGKIQTGELLSNVLKHEPKFTKGEMLSHTFIFEAEGYDRLIGITDSGMVIAPTLEQKAHMINNALEVFHAIGIDKPKVAILSGVEYVNPKLPCSVDAEKLVNMYKEGKFEGAIVDGPFALDNAINIEAAKTKGITSPIAGKADLLLVPNMVAGNMLAKSLIYFANVKAGGIIVGGKTPIILLSRADNFERKLNSIVLGIIAASNGI